MPSTYDTPSKVTHLPRGGRDGFIADTAIRLDRLESDAARLHHDMDSARSALVALLEHADEAKRFRTFEESLRNGRDYKIDEVLRTTRDLKTRLDRLEGDKSKFASLPYNSFETVNKRLQDLGRVEVAVESTAAQVRRASGYFYAAALVCACTILSYFYPVLGLG